MGFVPYIQAFLVSLWPPPPPGILTVAASSPPSVFLRHLSRGVFSFACARPLCVGRLEGLAGLSVQDAELKLFAEKPKPNGEEAGSSARNRRSHADGTVAGGTVAGDTTATDQAQGGDKEGLGADKESGEEKKKKTRNKNKAGKKKLAIVQRGPLLITHSGERRFSMFSANIFSGASVAKS